MSFFSAGSMTISIFSAVQVFCWIATVWKGRPVATAAMHFALGFVALLVIGGLNGIFTAIIPVDWQAHDTYFVVAHLALRADRRQCVSGVRGVLLLAAENDRANVEREAR